MAFLHIDYKFFPKRFGGFIFTLNVEAGAARAGLQGLRHDCAKI
jgi:hypothetical protein